MWKFIKHQTNVLQKINYGLFVEPIWSHLKNGRA